MGAARLFNIEAKPSGVLIHRTMINSGTYVVMDNGPSASFQKTWMHSIKFPRRKFDPHGFFLQKKTGVPPGLKTHGNQDGVRWNLTFRSILYNKQQQELARTNKRTRDEEE